MNTSNTRQIEVEAVLPHAPELVWKTLTSGELMKRWLRMPSTGFAAVVGTKFTYQTTPAGEWDGIIRCEVPEVVQNERLVYSWKGGHPSIPEGYGAVMDTVVTFSLSRAANGTRLRLVHAGFAIPRNERAYANMSDGWKGVVKTIGELSAEEEGAQ